MRLRLTSSVVLGMALMASSSAAFGTARTWGGAGGDGNWSTIGNWTNGVPVNGDTVSFGTPQAGGTRTTNNDISNLTLNGIAIPANAYALAGNAINLAGDVSFSAGTTSVSTISLVSILQQAINVNVSATTSSGRLEWDGDIQGNFGITKTNAGMLRFAGTAKTYTGDTTITGGTLDIAAANMLPFGTGKGNVVVGTTAILNLNNNDLTINGLNDVAGVGGAVNKTGSNTHSLSLGNNNADGSFAGTASFTGGSSTINKNGTGTQVMGGAVTLAGTSSVNGGRLVVDNTWSVGITVGAAGTLGGTGSIGGTVTVNGNLSPGGTLASDETDALLNVNNLTLNSTASSKFDIDGTTRDTQYDAIDAAGAVIYGGTLKLDFGGTVASGSTFDLLNFVSESGDFSAINLTGGYTGSLTNSGGVWTGTVGTQSFTFTESTGDLAVADATPAPEPASLGLLAAGTLGLLLNKRRRR